MSAQTAHNDSDELEALFDSIVAEAAQPAASPPGSARSTKAGAETPPTDVVNRLGQLTRSLHDSLRELGYDRVIEKAAQSIPDTQDRLQYIAIMTEKAASRVLSATEAAQPIQEQMSSDATQLSREWDRVFANEMSVADFKALAGRTQEFLREIPRQTKVTNDHLLEIMMAQDFQDLTGQVIKKMMDMTRLVEKQLLELLLEQLPPERKEQIEASGLAGPVVKITGSQDIVTNQQQVDDLLESLGF
ncbi:MAG: protein phosphatase CheZ [Betaproteobacteria bacterium]|jgi:chemotaxis protein CheZ